MNKIMDDRIRNILVMIMGIAAASIGAPLHAQFGSGGFGGAPGKSPTKIPAYRSPVIETQNSNKPIVSVKIIGHQEFDETKIRSILQTRTGRKFDSETVQGDVRKLSTTGWFHNVRTYKKDVPGGLEVTFEVFELPIIRHVRFVGNQQVRDKKLLKTAEIKVGEPLHRYRVEEARRRIEEYYVEKGYTDAEVEVKEGTKINDRGVVFAVHEGKMQQIWSTKFVGNQVVSDSRLKTQIKSKPGWLKYLGNKVDFLNGKVNLNEIDADVDRLTSYYRGLGYFNAQVSRTLDSNDAGTKLTITFVINEGPRYQIRNVSIVGNSAFTTNSLESRLTLKSGQFFNAKMMNTDLVSLRDAYGSQGYIHADIKKEIRFLEEPGQLDLVYDIAEGEQYRVGRIIVHIEGENPHTRKNVIMNRMSVAPGDIIDIREIRASERRLRSAQIFAVDPTRGEVPAIAIKPPELSETNIANRPPRKVGADRY